MKSFEKKVAVYVSDPDYRPVRIRELARKLGIKSAEYNSFRRAVKEMIADGKLARLRHGRIGCPVKESSLTGMLSVTRSGRGYIALDDDSGEVAVPVHLMAGAIHGDQVRFRLTGSYLAGKPVGEVEQVIERSVTQLVGNYRHSRFGNVVDPDDPKLTQEIQVAAPKGIRVESGMKVVTTVDPWQSPYGSLTGRIVEVLGFPTDPGVDMLAIIHQHGLPTEFPAIVEKQASEIPGAISQEEIEKRLDLRRQVVFTIDPDDAKDFDDAVSLERTNSGFRLGVHIADVSHYVAAGTRLDKEARSRCFSAYLADRVLPMLPERLSNDLCSLKEKQDRLTMSVLIDLNGNGQVEEYELCETIIRSRARLTYEQVQEYLETGKGFEKKKRVASVINLIEPVARLLIEQRMREGSIDLEKPEYKVRFDAEGRVSEVVRKSRKMSNRIVEEFMLLANKVVAREFLSRNIPTLYRVHPRPSEEKIASFVTFAQSLGYKASFGSPTQSKLIGRFITDLHGRPEEELLSDLLIRSMQKAVYQPDNVGHFGLGFPHYLHFTSPIRRYPDLMVHRLLRQVLRGHYRPARAGPLKSELKRIGRSCSEQEVNIMDAEMESLKAKQIEFLSRQLGEIFPGVISGMLRFGFFVRLRGIGAEGMVRLTTLRDDYYQADLDKHLVVGRRSGRRFRLGDKVLVQIVNVSLEAREIDLLLMEGDAGGRSRRERGKRKRRTR